MFRRLSFVGALFSAFLMAADPAAAATVTKQIDFTASTFTTIFGAAPVSPVIGSLTVTFDPALTYSDQASGVTLNSLNIALGSALSFSYGNDILIIGGLASGSAAITGGTNDFYLRLMNFSQPSPTFDFGYATTGSNGIFLQTSISGTVSDVAAAAVPEPSTWAMMLLGFGGVGLAMRRRRWVSASPAKTA